MLTVQDLEGGGDKEPYLIFRGFIESFTQLTLA
jgi:hypothetical protein